MCLGENLITGVDWDKENSGLGEYEADRAIGVLWLEEVGHEISDTRPSHARHPIHESRPSITHRPPSQPNSTPLRIQHPQKRPQLKTEGERWVLGAGCWVVY